MAGQSLAEHRERGPWRIGFSVPKFQPLHDVASGTMTQQAYIQQGHIALELAGRGHRLTVFGPHPKYGICCSEDTRNPSPASLTWSESRLFRLAAKGSWKVQRLLRVPYLNVFFNLRLFDASLHCFQDHDLVFERHGLYRSGVARACRSLGLPYVLFFDADPIYEQDYVGEPLDGILRWRAQQMISDCLRSAQHIVCPSSVIKKQLDKAWQVPEAKVTVLPNAVDVQRHRPYPELRKSVRLSLDLDDAAPVLIFVGRFYKWHDTDTLLRAFRMLLVLEPRLKLLMVGDGDRYEKSRAEAANLGLGDSVSFTGRVPNYRIPQLISAADIAVAPYPEMQDEFWGSPMKLFEYMACGTAIVASRAGQVSAVIRDRANGLLVPPGDVQAMAAALTMLIGDAGLRKRLGERAREDAVARHGWEQYVSQLEEIFASIIEDRTGRSRRTASR